MERIQATWTPAERRKRAGLPERDRWSPPAVELTEEKLLDE